MGQVTVGHCGGVGHVSHVGGVGQVVCPGMVGYWGQGGRGGQVGGSMADASKKINRNQVVISSYILVLTHQC